jgi:hypothetical protein
MAALLESGDDAMDSALGLQPDVVRYVLERRRDAVLVEVGFDEVEDVLLNAGKPMLAAL